MLLDPSATTIHVTTMLATLEEYKTRLTLIGDLNKLNEVIRFANLVLSTSTELENWHEAAEQDTI